ncbi:5-carboxymethyl-2-hydroxymuconate Delta-isomerase [Gammaproteobacteria bacterium AS21]
MPHCIIEYSTPIQESVPAKVLLNTVHKAAINSQLFSVDDIKTRLVPFSQDQLILATANFIHVSVHILSGRTIEQRAQLSALMLKALNELVLESISISVNIVELERDCYAKTVK